MSAMRGLRADALLQLPVRLNGIRLGRPVDVILDLPAERAIGLDVLCGDNLHRFLALGAATVGPDEIAIDSALLLLEDVELAFYRKRGSTLRSLRGRPVARSGPLRDLVLGEAWTIDQLVVDGEGGATTVPFDPALALVPAA